MSSRLKDLFKGSVSRVIGGLQLPTIRALQAAKPKTAVVTSSCGKPGAPFRRIIRYEQRTLHSQIGWKREVDGKIVPILQAKIYHFFLHATKGWRRFALGLPMPNPPRFAGLPRNPAPHWDAHSKRGVTVENKKGAKHQ